MIEVPVQIIGGGQVGLIAARLPGSPIYGDGRIRGQIEAGQRG